MGSIIERLKNEPVVVIGAIFAAALGAIGPLAAAGLVSADLNDSIHALFAPNSWLLSAAVVIVSFVTRRFTSPAR